MEELRNDASRNNEIVVLLYEMVGVIIESQRIEFLIGGLVHSSLSECKNNG